MAGGRAIVITGEQIRAARLLLGWSKAKLARKSGVSDSSIWHIENGSGRSREQTLAKVGVALLDTRVSSSPAAPTSLG
jgi:transcriptional regulator with XRE-family HTH domain